MPISVSRCIRVAAAIAGLTTSAQVYSAESIGLSELQRRTHFHGIAVDRADPSRLYLATHHGLFLVSADGKARPVSERNDDFMGFTPHPRDPTTLYASGHPATGGNLGFVMSTDGGKSWRQLSPGMLGPVDFHQMDVSKADPRVIYGAFKGLQVSQDGGRTWTFTGSLPEKLIALAASAIDVKRLYAATERGLLVTHDSGNTWQSAYMLRQPVTMVHVTDKHEVFAFVTGVGLIRGTEPELRWQTLNGELRQQFMLHLAVDPSNGNKLYAVMTEGQILKSSDGGRGWASFGQ